MIVSQTSNWRLIYDPETDRYNRNDVYFSPIIKEAERRGLRVLCIDIDWSSFGDFRVTKERIIRTDQDWIPFECFYDAEAELKLKDGERWLRDTWKFLQSSEEFHKVFTYKGRNLWSLLQTDLTYVFEVVAPRCLKALETAKRSVAVIEPMGILSTSETDFYGLAYLAAARPRGIPTFGLAHSYISCLNWGYLHKKVSLSQSEWGFPVPDGMFVTDQRDFRTLTEWSCYPPKSVIVIGQPRYDSLFAMLKRTLDRREVARRYGLDQNVRLILVATGANYESRRPVRRVLKAIGVSPPGSRDDDIQILRAVINVIEKRPGLQVALRLHPLDDSVAYATVLRERKLPVRIFKGELYDLVWYSDVVVTLNSTVGLEAGILGRPIVYLDSQMKSIFGTYARLSGFTELERVIEETLDSVTKSAVSGHRPGETQNSTSKLIDTILAFWKEGQVRTQG